MDTIQINLKLQKVIHKLLSNTELFGGNTRKLQDDFSKGLYEVLEISFNINSSNSRINKHIAEGKINNPIDNTRFVAETIENESTYILLNYYFIEFLFQFDEIEDEIERYLEREGLSQKNITSIINQYANYTDSIKYQKSQQLALH